MLWAWDELGFIPETEPTGESYSVWLGFVPLGTVAVEAGTVGAIATEGLEPGAEVLAGPVQGDAGVVRGHLQRLGGLLDGFTIEVHATEQFGVLGLEGVHHTGKTAAELRPLL